MATWAWMKQDLHLPARRLPKVARKWHRSLSWSWRRDGVSSEWSEIKTTGGAAIFTEQVNSEQNLVKKSDSSPASWKFFANRQLNKGVEDIGKTVYWKIGLLHIAIVRGMIISTETNRIRLPFCWKIQVLYVYMYTKHKCFTCIL